MKKFEAPKDLSKEATMWWNNISKEYGINDSAGCLLLTTAMESFDRMRQAQVAVKKHGVVVLDRYKQTKSNPATIVEKDSRAQMLASLKASNLDLEPLKDGPGRPAGA